MDLNSDLLIKWSRIYTVPSAATAFAIPTDQGRICAFDEIVFRESISKLIFAIDHLTVIDCFQNRDIA